MEVYFNDPDRENGKHLVGFRYTNSFITFSLCARWGLQFLGSVGKTKGLYIFVLVSFIFTRSILPHGHSLNRSL